MTESNQKEPLDLHAMHTLYSGCTPREKCELIERIWAQDSEIEGLKSSFKNARDSVHRMQAERDELRATLTQERDALRLVLQYALKTMQTAHACATWRSDGTCDGCFVSIAIEGILAALASPEEKPCL